MDETVRAIRALTGGYHPSIHDDRYNGKLDMKEALKALTAIAEGYSAVRVDDRFIYVLNPDYQEDRGDNVNLVIDVWEMKKWLSQI